MLTCYNKFIISRTISYTIYSSHLTCGLNGDSLERDDMLEFSIRFSSNPSEWIPLSLTYIDQASSNCRRGYCVKETSILLTYIGSPKPYIRSNIIICGFFPTDSIQIRWLMSSHFMVESSVFQDKWSLDDIQVNLITENISVLLFEDNFDSPILK